jgi:transcription-repair coupling factor (superfamily II helicase)
LIAIINTKQKLVSIERKAISIRQLKDLNPGDYVTHIDHGVGKFSGLEKVTVNGQTQEMVRLIYKDQ